MKALEIALPEMQILKIFNVGELLILRIYV